MIDEFKPAEVNEQIELGRVLREAREKCGCTQEEFAKILGASTNTLAQWERGTLKASGANKRKIRHIQSITKNTRVLDVIQNVRMRDDGKPATAALLAMLLGLIEYSGLGFGAVEFYVKPGSALVNAVKELANGLYEDTFNRFQKEIKK